MLSIFSLWYRSFLLLGVNDVARGLETNSIASVLISNEADPPIMTQHLSTLAVTKNVPHLVLQNLKVSTKKTLDFSCLTIGFKVCPHIIVVLWSTVLEHVPITLHVSEDCCWRWRKSFPPNPLEDWKGIQKIGIERCLRDEQSMCNSWSVPNPAPWDPACLP